MPLRCQPEHLEQLSVHSIGKYVSDLCVLLVTTAKQSASPDLTSISSSSWCQVKQTCDRLHHHLHSLVPYSMANQLTMEFVRQIDERYHDLCKWINQPWCRSIIQMFLKSVIHQKTTELHISWECNFILVILLNILDAMPHLKSLKILLWNEQKYRRNGGRDSLKLILINNLGSVKNLETFVLRKHCTDNIIEIICKHHPELKYLDISKSNGVSDTSIENILTLKCLEGIDISKTGISNVGEKCLMMALSLNTQTVMKEIGFTFISSVELKSLVASFPHLRCLNIRVNNFVRSYWYDTLQLLTNLEELKISGCKTISLPVLENLLELDLDVYDIDAQVLAGTCPSLQRLSLKAIMLRCSEGDQFFTSLQSLKIWTINFSALQGIISLCTNLKTLKLCTNTHTSYFESSFPYELTQSNPFISLENLCLGSIVGNVLPETITTLTQHCTNLRTCKVFGTKYEKLKALYTKCSGVDVDRDSWIIED